MAPLGYLALLLSATTLTVLGASLYLDVVFTVRRDATGRMIAWDAPGQTIYLSNDETPAISNPSNEQLINSIMGILYRLTTSINDQTLNRADHYGEFMKACSVLSRAVCREAAQDSLYDDLFDFVSTQSDGGRLQPAIKWMIKIINDYRAMNVHPLEQLLEYDFASEQIVMFVTSVLRRMPKEAAVFCSPLWFELLLYGYDNSGRLQDYFKEFIGQLFDEPIEKRAVEILEMARELIRQKRGKIRAEDGVMLMFLFCADDQNLMGKMLSMVEEDHSTFTFPKVFLPRWMEYHTSTNSKWLKPDHVLMRYAKYLFDTNGRFHVDIPDTFDHILHHMFRCITHIVINGEEALRSDPVPTLHLIQQLIQKAVPASERSGISRFTEKYYHLAAQLIKSSDRSLSDILAAIKRGFGINSESDWRINFKHQFGDDAGFKMIDNDRLFVVLALIYDADWSSESLFCVEDAQRCLLSCLFQHSSWLVQMISYCAALPAGSNQAVVFPSELQFRILNAIRCWHQLSGKHRDQDDCTICLQTMSIEDDLRSVRQCHHVFHRKCIETWLEYRMNCPLCKFDYVPSQSVKDCEKVCLKQRPIVKLFSSRCKQCMNVVCDRHRTTLSRYRSPVLGKHVFHFDCLVMRLKNDSLNDAELQAIIHGIIGREYGLAWTLNQLIDAFRKRVIA